jgi:excisionase family DNA binding protein
MKKLYNISETAKELCVSRPTIYKWIKKGQLKTINLNGLTRVKDTEIKRLREDN